MKLARARICSGIFVFLVLALVGALNVVTHSSTAFADDSTPRRFAPIILPISGTLTVSIDQSLTVEQLHGKSLDQSPPKQVSKPTYPDRHSTRVRDAYVPYMAKNIAPFQFDHFTVEWNYGGWHTWEMRDYALRHGFNIAYLYSQNAVDVPIAPSEYLQWGNLNWDQWMADNGYPYQRWDQLPEQEQLVNNIVAQNKFPLLDGHKHLMIDMEYPTVPIPEDQLRQQPWYPNSAPDVDERVGPDFAFEEQYYDGYVKTQVAAAEAAHAQGWEQVGFYGWAPFQRLWWGLEDAVVNPAEDWAWNTYGKDIYSADAVDVIYPSVYSFYWSDQNVAYGLANTDLNMQFVNSAETQKPVRPYFWNALHGGGYGWRWWRNLPIRNEDAQAMSAMNFLTGSDGLVLWSWSGTGNPNMVEVEPIDCNIELLGELDCSNDAGSYATKGNYSVKNSFELAPVDSVEPTQFEKYDALIVLDIDETAGIAYFQRVAKNDKFNGYGIDLGWQIGQPATYPIYAMDTSALASNLRAATEPVASMIEGLALVKPFERWLFEGEPKIDVPAQQQFADVLPIVRRVEFEEFQIIATYDPQWEAHDAPRTIELNDFNGIKGLNVVLPADEKTRLFVLQSLPNYAGRSLVSGQLTINGEPAPIGTEVEMRNAAGERAGITFVNEEGHFSMTPVFGSDTGESFLGIGMKEGQIVRFFVDGEEAKALVDYHWSNDATSQVHDVQLLVGAIATNIGLASMSVSTATSGIVLWGALLLSLLTTALLKIERRTHANSY